MSSAGGGWHLLLGSRPKPIKIRLSKLRFCRNLVLKDNTALDNLALKLWTDVFRGPKSHGWQCGPLALNRKRAYSIIDFMGELPIIQISMFGVGISLCMLLIGMKNPNVMSVGFS